MCSIGACLVLFVGVLYNNKYISKCSRQTTHRDTRLDHMASYIGQLVSLSPPRHVSTALPALLSCIIFLSLKSSLTSARAATSGAEMETYTQLHAWQT